MAEGVSRRSTRSFVAEQDCMEGGSVGLVTCESQYGTSFEESRKERCQRESSVRTASSTDSLEGCFGVALGAETGEGIGKPGSTSVRLPVKVKEDGRPLNFGIVSPGHIYRSSFPQLEDYQYLGTLGLKTIITLRKQPFDDHFAGFMKSHRIRHQVFEMYGTKKVKIPDAMMKAIMKITLDERNHPVLIHCNHGIHRTGCAVAVMRLAYGLDVDSATKEYSGFAGQKVRDCDLSYINTFDITSVQGLMVKATEATSLPVSANSKLVRILCITVLALVFGYGVWCLWKN